jgi:TonB family protein
MDGRRYIQEREKQSKLSRATGVVLTLCIHCVLIACFLITGFTYLDPPPPERDQILIDFEEIKPAKPKQTLDGTKPRAPKAEKELNLVQQSEAQHEGTKANEAPEATPGDQGDVEVPEPPREKEIDRRALFSSAKNKTQKDTLAAQTSEKVSEALKAGHALGNTKTGETFGSPKADLAGRTHNGTLPKPSYSVQASGKVVVEIWVDNYGIVKRAVAGAEGTTVTDKKLWQAARNAAMEASFNMSADAPALQKGTITYIFKLK